MISTTRALGSIALSIPLLGLACSGPPSSSSPSPEAATGLPAGHPVIEASRLVEAPEPGAGPTTGVVLETMDGGGYTYARIDFEGTERWVAGPPVGLAPGDTVTVPDMANMGAFSSPSLGRSFEELYFTGAFVRPGAVRVAHRAVVEQVVAAGSYVYLEVESEGAKRWLAAPAAEVREGDSVGWNGGSVMRDFTSSTLGRTFAEILFVEAVTVLR